MDRPFGRWWLALGVALWPATGRWAVHVHRRPGGARRRGRHVPRERRRDRSRGRSTGRSAAPSCRWRCSGRSSGRRDGGRRGRAAPVGRRGDRTRAVASLRRDGRRRIAAPARRSSGPAGSQQTHLGGLARLGRTELVGVVSRTPEAAAATAETWGGRATPTWTRCSTTRGPTSSTSACRRTGSVAIGERLVEPRHPVPRREAAGRRRRRRSRAARGRDRAAGLVVAVGYHWRGLDLLPAIRERLAARPPRLSSRAGSAARRRRSGGDGSTRAAARSSSRRRTSWTSRDTSSARPR